MMTAKEFLESKGINTLTVKGFKTDNVNGKQTFWSAFTIMEQYAQHVCKDKKNNIEERTEILDPYPFERFWALYDKKVGKKSKIESKWNKLSEKVRKEIMEYIPYYRQSQPSKQYRKNPETFLNNEGWKDEIIKTDNGTTYTDKIEEYLGR